VVPGLEDMSLDGHELGELVDAAGAGDVEKGFGPMWGVGGREGMRGEGFQVEEAGGVEGMLRGDGF